MTEELQPAGTGQRDIPKNLQPYFLCLLRKGERWNEIEGSEAADLLPKHLSFLRQQAEAGRYLVAGPALDGEEIVGLSIAQARSLSEAQTLAESDPGVRAGRLRVTVHPVLLPSLSGVVTRY